MICHLLPVSLDTGVKSFLKAGMSICHVSFIPLSEDYDAALIITPFSLSEWQVILFSE